ncbi:MAG: hypothetical protein JW881_01375, partial [Spirochaetales bacterium]|nr:hypothetical protein [Spirochaetales bacterium]
MYKKIIIFITGLLIVSTCPALAQEGCTCLSGCESVSDTSTNFEKNGKGDFCFRFDCIGGYINSWNMETVEINNVDITNKWVPAISLPEKIDGVYYVFCRGNNEWSHFEAIGGCGSTIESTPVPFVADIPAAVTVSSEGDGAVDISVFPPTQTVYTGDDVTVEIHIASETLKIAAYGINIGFDDLLLEIDTSMGVNGVQEGSDGFLSAVNIQKDGEIKTSGFDTAGKGPGSDLHLLTVYFKAIEEGISEIDINVIDLTDEHTQMIGFLPVTGGSVVILESGTDPQSTAPPTSPPVETVMPTIFSSDPPTPQPTLIGPSEDDYPAWRARFFYRRGDRVFYDGVNYECIAWWSYNQRPPYHPYIWKEAGKAVTNPPTPAPTDSPTFEPTSPPAMSEPPAATPAMEGCMCDSCCDTVIQISTDFTQDGPGEYCWFIPCVGSFINSWNLLTLSINGVDFTNSWKIPEELPPPVDGGYYIFYRGTYTWSHFEAKGICEGIPTDLPATPAPEVTDTVSEAPTSGSTPEPTAESTTEPTLAPTPVLTAVPTAEPT